MVEAGSPNIADYFPVLKRWDLQGSRRRLEGHFGRMFDIFDGLIEERLGMRVGSGWRRRDDVLDVVGMGSIVEESDVPRLPYLQAIIKETFRLHPSGPLLVPRISGEDKRVGGYIIPKGAQVLVNIWGMGRDPSVWGMTAGEFMPGNDREKSGEEGEEEEEVRMTWNR